MNAVKKWLSDEDHIHRVPFKEAYLVLQQLSENEIGIRGSNIFILTYSLLGTVSRTNILLCYFNIGFLRFGTGLT